MELDPQLLKQLLETFRVELEEQLQVITDGLLRLEKRLKKETRQDTLNAIFRAAHNIKGSARAIEIQDVSDIAHRLENLFSTLKEQNTKPSAGIVDLCLETLDRVRDAMAAHGGDTQVNRDYADLFARLDAAVNAETAEATVTSDVAGSDEPADVRTSGSDTGVSNIEAASAGADEEPAPDSRPAPETPAEAAPGAVAAMQQGGPEMIRVTTDKLDRVAALVEELQLAKIGMDDHFAGIQRLANKMQGLATLWSRSTSMLNRRAKRALPDDIQQLFHKSLDAVEELNALSNRMHKDMRSTTNRLGHVSNTLQGDVRMLRLVPASTLLRPMLRSVRDIARELGKRVHLELVGDDIEMDRAVLEGLRDPLTHLLRNAIDHGIEAPDKRRESGKPEEGQIRIEVSREGGQILLSVRDDGKGVDLSRIGQIAENKGLLDARAANDLSEEELLDLIFHPGFSSKEIITQVSGRGVGLDVVRANLRELKGQVAIETEVGRGTAFNLRVPLTLTTERGLQVRAGGEEFVIPSTAVERILDVTPADVLEVEASQAVMLDGRPIPLRDLGATLELSPTDTQGKSSFHLVVVSKGWRAVAFLVHEVIGEREIVIKRLGAPLVSVRNTSGATLTGSGDIIMVLNTSDLVESSLNGGARSRVVTAAPEEIEEMPSRVLVVDDSITTRTLERNILEVHGYDVTVAMNGSEAWDILQNDSFDLVVTDIEMPIMTGFELTERIKQDERLVETPVIIVSSLSSDAEKERGIEVGADAYIVKGHFETQALLDVVRRLI